MPFENRNMSNRMSMQDSIENPYDFVWNIGPELQRLAALYAEQEIAADEAHAELNLPPDAPECAYATQEAVQMNATSKLIKLALGRVVM